MIKSYDELVKLKSFDERFEYLRMTGIVGAKTFGYDRYLNQILYTSRHWLHVRDQVIVRDNGNDLGVMGYPIRTKIIVHHINPITIEDIDRRLDSIFDLNFLICVSHKTHLAIHYSDKSLLDEKIIVRKSGDTIPWL